MRLPRHNISLLTIAILLIAFTLRIVSLTRMPLFLDEAFHIMWTHRVIGGETFIGFQNNKMLYPIFLALFNPTGIEGVWLTRSLSALIGCLVTALCIRTGITLYNEKVGIFAGLFYAILPFAVFHERQALTDPFMALFTTAMMLLTIKMIRRPQPLIALGLGLSLAGAYLTKIAALPYFFLLPAAYILLNRKLDKRLRTALMAGVATGIALLVITIVSSMATRSGAIPSAIYQVDIRNIGGNSSDIDLLSRLVTDLGDYGEMSLRYIGVMMIALIGLSVIGAVKDRKIREILYLAVPGFGFALLPLLASRPAGFLAPRYLLTTAAPLTILAGIGAEQVIWGIKPERRRAVSLALILAILIQPMWFNLQLIHSPLNAPLTRIDKIQYLTGSAAGQARLELVNVLLAKMETEEINDLMIINKGGSRVWFQAYLGVRETLIERSYDSKNEVQRRLLAEHMARGAVFTVEELGDGELPDSIHGAERRGIENFSSGQIDLRLSLLTEAEGELAELIYIAATPKPESLTDDLKSLNEVLEGFSLVFPAHYKGYLPSNSYGLSSTNYPLSDGMLEGLKTLPEVTESDIINLILIDEVAVDPEQIILREAQENLYRLDERWFGLIHLIRFVSGGSALQPDRSDTVFEGGIKLMGVAIQPPETDNKIIRVELEWETSVQIADSFAVFAHVIDKSGNIIVQHDGIPGDGLYPMTSWVPGELVPDQFAIILPEDILLGEYGIRLGIYHPVSGLRLPIIAGEGVGTDHAIIGYVTID